MFNNREGVPLILNLLNPAVTHASFKLMSDEEVLEQYLLSQNVHYFNLLYDRYSDKVFAKCIAMLKFSDLAEDATQEIFVKILLSLSRFSGKSKFSTWLYAVTYNYCVDLIRKNKKSNTETIEDANKMHVIDTGIEDAEILETNVLRLKEVMEQMNIEDKTILMMKYQDDLSIREICEVTSKTESAVKMKILRAKERFVKIYKQNYSHII